MKLKKGTWISFHPTGEFIDGLTVMGQIIGNVADIKRMFPEEYFDLSDDAEFYLIRRNIPAMGITRHYVLFPKEILEKSN